MGCSSSKLDDEEAVQLCKDRKQFIKQAVEQRTRFASGHLAYIQSLRRVSAALRDYFEVDGPREFLLDSFVTPPFTPVKKPSPGFISISPKSFSPAKIKDAPNSTVKIHYSRAGGNQAVSVEERPRSPETFRVETYSPMYHSSVDGFFSMQAPPMSSTLHSYHANNTATMPPPSPQTSQWDSFWNPFSSIDYYGYSTRSSLDQMVMDDDIRGLRRVREEEGIPELEDETEQEEMNRQPNVEKGGVEIIDTDSEEGVVVEDVDEDEDDETEDSGCECECEHVIQELNSSNGGKIEVSRAQNMGQVEVQNKEIAAGEGGGKSEMPGFTVYVNRRPTSMGDVIKDLEEQFTVICNSAKEVSALLESDRVQYLSTSNDHTAMKMLNPVALFRSASSRSSSSRYVTSISTSKDDEDESSSDHSEESCILSGSHQSTLDRLYAWEKKLYEEVRSGERVRLAYEKKCAQLRNQDVKGEDPSAVDKTRAAIRDMHTQIKVSIHSVEAISKRIETLRDEELQPQLFELVQGLARMWKVMAESHQTQKRAIDEAKLLLAAGTPSKLAKRYSFMPNADPQRTARTAANMETELRNWRACFDAWITSQRSYLHALSGWLLRCIRCDPDASKLSLSPRRSSGTLPVFGLCLQWSNFLDAVHEKPVLDGIDFFAAGMGYVTANQLRDDSHHVPAGSRRFETATSTESRGNMELVEYHEEEETLTAEKMAEVSSRILCAGMSVAVSSLTEFAIRSADGYTELIKQWEIGKVSS